MRIISNFKDYYDPIQKLAYNPNVIYQRTMQTIDFTIRPSNINCSKDYMTERLIIIGFCGSLYPLIGLRETNTSQYEYFTTEEDVHNYMRRYPKKLKDYERDHMFKFSKKDVKKHFKSYPKTHSYTKIFLDYGVPIFVWDRNLILNPRLTDYRFQVIKEPYTAFQEISTFISGSLCPPPKQIPQPSDEDMCELKGFNKKYSFRKDPTKRNK